MKFIPNSDIKENMLKDIDLKSIDELFSDIPKDIQIKKLQLDEGLSQQETEKKLRNIANKNKSCQDSLFFLGGGVKPHYIPPVVKSIISRSEFYTAYTPYQSEASQGFLQAMFEYQSMIAEITGMDVANCSVYDGVTALSEAALMCSRIKRKNKFIIASNISWDKKCVLNNYTKGPGIEIVEIDYDVKTGKIDLNDLKKKIDDTTAGVYIENPNFFGIFEDEIEKINELIKSKSALFVVGIDPVSLGVVSSPGEYGADIVIGEGRSFGNPMDYGGCGLGIFACKQEYIRNMPGRIIGLTADSDGKRSFCMSLQTREQHIRRARATSNICTNEGLCSLAACVYMSYLGGQGLYNLSKKNLENSQKLVECLEKIDNIGLKFTGSFFNEIVVEIKDKPSRIIKKLLDKNIQIGPVLSDQFPELINCILIGVTEIHTDEDIEKLTNSLKEVL